MEPNDFHFRREAGRMVATLARVFGMHNLALAEDVVQDAFCRALEVWKFQGRAGESFGVADGHSEEPRSRYPEARAHSEHVCAGAGQASPERIDARACS